jgi:hypothetical protein
MLHVVQFIFVNKKQQHLEHSKAIRYSYYLFFSNLLLQNISSPIIDAFAMTTTKVRPHHPTPMGHVHRILGLGLIPITTQNNKN